MLAKDTLLTEKKYTKIRINMINDRYFVCDVNGQELTTSTPHPT
jgi:hypothetical protein